MSAAIFNNIKKNKEFERICYMPQKKLKDYLVTRLNMQSGDGWAFREGTFPVLLTAHMDTVHKRQCNKAYYNLNKDGNVVVSSRVGIGGDDRCGIYMILKILNEVDCSVLFCEDEEVGSIGAGKFVKTELCESLKGKFKYIIELDRANSKDAVFYEDANDKFHEFVTKEFWKESWGTWSDICTLSPALEISSVNFSCGYYKAHTTQEYVVLDEMEKSISEVIKLLKRTDVNAEPFKFERQKYNYSRLFEKYCGYGYGYGLDDYYDYTYGYGYGERKINKSLDDLIEEEEINVLKSDDDVILIEAILANGEFAQGEGTTEDKAWVNLFMSNPTLRYCDIIDYYYY